MGVSGLLTGLHGVTVEESVTLGCLEHRRTRFGCLILRDVLWSNSLRDLRLFSQPRSQGPRERENEGWTTNSRVQGVPKGDG